MLIENQPDDAIEAAMLDCFRQADAKYLQQPAHLVRQINGLVQQGFPCAQQCPNAVRLPALHMNRAEPTVRKIWAMPRASLRSVLLRIAESAAQTWRASMQTTSNPSAFNPWNKCWLKVPDSNPMRWIETGSAFR